MKFNFLPKLTIPKRIKDDTLTNKGNKIRGRGEQFLSRLCKFRGGNWNLVLEIIQFIHCLIVFSFVQLIIKNMTVLLKLLHFIAESERSYNPSKWLC